MENKIKRLKSSKVELRRYHAMEGNYNSYTESLTLDRSKGRYRNRFSKAEAGRNLI